MRNRGASRGMTVLEVLIALGLMMPACVLVLSMITDIMSANRRGKFQSTSVDAFGRLAAEIEAAPCDIPPGSNAPANPTTDAGLLAGAGNWIGPCASCMAPSLAAAAIPAGSSISYVGQQGTTPPLFITYEATMEPVVAEQAPAFDITVRIREITGDPQKDQASVVNGYWIRTFPLKKVCRLRAEDVGRGEFY